MRTGGGPPEKPLSDLEARLIEVIGSGVVEGILGVSEFGISNEPTVMEDVAPEIMEDVVSEITEAIPPAKKRCVSSISTMETTAAQPKTLIKSVQSAFEQNQAQAN
ncbi:hypothetical protein RN001_005838 [Aquatica leii]|uniref:Uncharacterized protein n=1 Tax=Aquatica leii TaxID=1421715 RepID=A0AAN7PCV5_9COLE|nr:hypothetical protein RN001_005838 [Aquatica leii]